MAPIRRPSHRALLPLLALTFGTATLTHCGNSQVDSEIENLRAFAKLYGYVRYFHPSDEAAALDWEAFAVLGASRVKDAPTTQALKGTLEELFLPIAPTLRLFEDGESVPEPPPELFPPNAPDLERVAWQHQGVGFGSANSVYQSARLNRETTLTGGAANAVLTQCLDGPELEGKQFRFTGFGKVVEPGASVQLWLRVDLRSGDMGFFDNMMDRPVTAPEWTELLIEGQIDEDVFRVCVGAIFLGGNTALDDLRLEVQDADRWVAAPLVNGDFEEGDEGTLSGWATPSQGWRYAPEEADAVSGDRYLSVAQSRTSISGPIFDHAPDVGEVAEKRLGRDLVARIPLALFSQDGHTLGTPEPDGAAALSASLAEMDLAGLTAESEALRLANVLMAWNVFQHFYPYFDVVDTDWDAVLSTGLRRALSDRTPSEFLSTLRWMVSQLRDGHGYVTGPEPRRLGLPLTVDFAEGEVVVVATDAAESVQVGDVITAIDDRPAVAMMEELAGTFSGSPQWRRWRALVQLGYGPPESEALLGIERKGEALQVALTRTATQPPQEPRPETIEELEPGIFYVNLDQVEINAFQERAQEMASARGVVFDLRGYPNGNHLALTYLTDQNLNCAFWRVPQIIYPDHDGEAHYRESRWDLPPCEPRFRGTIVFLTNGRAISYAESVMGIVEHYRLGEIVGEPTAGANGNVNPFTLPGGYRFTWTGMQVIKHDGSQHHMVGIQPTIPTSRTIQGIREGRDELLDKALEVIRGS